MPHEYALKFDGETKVKLDKIDTADTAGLHKEEGLERLEKLGAEFNELVNLLTFAGQNALLVVLQGRDAAGKDGTIRRILASSNVLNARVWPFKVPTDEEKAHDFLWRIHKVAPPRGQMALFNRSHYEDVVAARVHELVPEKKWQARYAHIKAFERMLGDNDTLVLKFFLHISRREQYERLLEREQGPRTAWKLSPADWREFPLWDQTTRAYEDAISECSSEELPFYVVPADKKWFRNLAVMERLVLTLRPHRERWLDHLEEMGKDAIKEIKRIRRDIPRPKK
jgi:PPK2 family polyphosphate:nucleotide phosphotransferase